jgi:hypothetical protein
LKHHEETARKEPTMTIYTDTTHILIAERTADLRREADRERLARAARLARPHRRRAPRPWWHRLGRQQLGTSRPARVA